MSPEERNEWRSTIEENGALKAEVERLKQLITNEARVTHQFAELWDGALEDFATLDRHAERRTLGANNYVVVTEGAWDSVFHRKRDEIEAG